MSAAEQVLPSTQSAAPSVNGGGLVQLCINTIRTVSMDTVQQAKSGHPGTPMALAPLVYAIWNRALMFDPQDPLWPNRDRFVLSNGHASMLLWSMLHLTRTKAVNAQYARLGQVSATSDDIRRFRQIDLPPHVKARTSVEQASSFGWERYVGRSGHIVGMTTFGASALLKELQRKFGFQPGRLVALARELSGRG